MKSYDDNTQKSGAVLWLIVAWVVIGVILCAATYTAVAPGW